MADLKVLQYFTSHLIFIVFVALVALFNVPECNPKMLNDDQFYGDIAPVKTRVQKKSDVSQSFNYSPNAIRGPVTAAPDDVIKEDMVPDYNKVVVKIKVLRPIPKKKIISDLSIAASQLLKIPLENVKVSDIEVDRTKTGTVKMYLKRDPRNGFDLFPATEAMQHLAAKRFQEAVNSVNVLSVKTGEDHRQELSGKINVESMLSEKTWETWQLVVTVCTCLFAVLCVALLIFFLGSRRGTSDKVAPMEEPRQVVVQPVLRPAVAGVGVIQPENRDLRVAETRENPIVETDSEVAPSPSRSPMRIKGKGLLERRGSNASLTLDLNRSQENIHCGTPPKECSAEEYLLSASKRMTRRQLRNCLKDVKALHSEFWEIPMNHPEKVEVAGSGTKNRYKTILPNESTRVLLYEKSEDPLSAYINANYVKGYASEQNAYIATQGPMPHTINDFWLMVWKEKSPLIVMITKLKEKLKVKCEPYIPDRRGRYLDIEVTVVRVVPRDGYTIRELFLRRGNETHTVYHFWYTAWPDHKTPHTAKQMLAMALEAEGLRHDTSGATKGPMVVHCSAGIGRTGCFIAASIGIQQLLEENKIDVLAIVCSLRLDRGGMVQTAEQYEFVHQALSMFENTLPGTSGD